MVMNIAAHQAGNRTMYASFEMTNTEQSTRHDALRAGVSLSHLQRGGWTDIERQKVLRMMHAMQDGPNMILVHDPAGVTTVSAVAAKIAQHHPDVVFIDGTYLMDCEEPGITPGTPQALTSMTRSLKRLAQRFDVPIVQTTQALGWKSRGGRLSIDSIGYSSSFAQDSDVIFGVEQVPDEDQQLNLRIIASRNCARRDVLLKYDLDHGSIMETDEITYDSDDE
jgi:replicative DNA helicase